MGYSGKEYGFEVRAVNPPFVPGSTERIEIDPTYFLELSRQRGTFLGRISRDWVAVSPENQSVPETGDGTQLMIFPQAETFTNPASLSLSELSSATDFALSFLEYARRERSHQMAVVGYNICEDPLGRKVRIQSWPQFHMHGMLFPSDMQPLTHFPKSFRELGAGRTEKMLSSLLSADCRELVERVNIGSEKENLDPFLPRSGLLYRFADQLPIPGVIAWTIQELHKQYRHIHRKVFSLFVENYRAVKDNRWLVPYRLRQREAIADRIISSGIPWELQSNLLAAGRALRSAGLNGNSRNQLFRSPSYSTALFLGQDGDLYLFFRPNLSQTAGFPQAVGINVIRQQAEGTPITARIERAKELFEAVC